MDGIINSIKESLVDFVDMIITSLLTWLTETILVPFVTWCRTFGDDFFSGFIRKAIQVLCQTPKQWNSDGWSFIMETVNVVFVVFGCQLVVLFFLIGFIADSIDPRHDVRIETIMKALFKIILAEYLVCASGEIITTFFGFVGTLTGGYANPSFTMPTWQILNASGDLIELEQALLEIDFVPLLLTVLFAFVYMLVMLAAGVIIAYTAYMRFFKIMLIIPYGSLASSTVAGNGALSHTAMQFYKYVLCVVLEAVTIIVAIGLYARVMGGTQFNFISTADFNMAEDAYILIAFLNRALAAILLVGAVKGAGALTQKVLGA